MSQRLFPPISVEEVETDFERTLKTIIPKEGEVRVLANRNQECRYYYVGVERCRDQLLEEAGDKDHPNHSMGFLPCKKFVDAHYKCMTEGKYGDSLEDVPEIGKKPAAQFFNCAYRKLGPMPFCRRYFDEVVRNLYRSKDNKLNDNY